MDITPTAIFPIPEVEKSLDGTLSAKPDSKVNSKLATFGEETEDIGPLAQPSPLKSRHRRNRVFHVWDGSFKPKQQREEVNSAPIGGITPPVPEYRRSNSVDFPPLLILKEEVSELDEKPSSPPPGYLPPTASFKTPPRYEAPKEFLELRRARRSREDLSPSAPPRFEAPKEFLDLRRSRRGIEDLSPMKSNAFGGLKQGSLKPKALVFAEKVELSFSDPNGRLAIRSELEGAGLFEVGAMIVEEIFYKLFNLDEPKIQILDKNPRLTQPEGEDAQNYKAISFEVENTSNNYWGGVYRKLNQQKLAASKIFSIFRVSVLLPKEKEGTQEVVFAFKPNINLNSKLLFAKNSNPAPHVARKTYVERCKVIKENQVLVVHDREPAESKPIVTAGPVIPVQISKTDAIEETKF